MSELTAKEIKELESTLSEIEWNAVCDRIKEVRSNQYPSDWYKRIVLSGFMARVASSWGDR